MRPGIAVILLLTASCASATTPEQTADEYAKSKSGGQTLGCSKAEPGPEAERTPGCIYSAAFAGCAEGLTGEQVGPLPAAEEWANEPKLLAIHNQAVKDCTPTR